MKKNNMLRLASVLLVAVLLSTCAISGVFAKYMVTDTLENQAAAVANWGVKVTVADNAAFADAYKDGAVNYVANETGDAITVQANTQGTKIVAPGTNGSFGTVTVTDNVNREVDMLAEVQVNLALANWTINGDHDSNPATPDQDYFYCPIVIKVGTATLDGENYDTAADFEKAVEDAIAMAIIKAETSDFDDITGKYSVHYDTDVACDSAAAAGVEITWAWDYAEDYTKDTQLGDAATKATIALDYTVTFTQVD